MAGRFEIHQKGPWGDQAPKKQFLCKLLNRILVCFGHDFLIGFQGLAGWLAGRLAGWPLAGWLAAGRRVEAGQTLGLQAGKPAGILQCAPHGELV